METAEGRAREGSIDGNGGRLHRKLALKGLFLMSLALACVFHAPQERLSAGESFHVAFYHLALLVLFLSGQWLVLLSVWASDHPTSGGALANHFAN